MNYKNYYIRFKTKKEFEDEFGENWRNTVCCSFVSRMDILLGKKINKIYNDGFLNIINEYNSHKNTKKYFRGSDLFINYIHGDYDNISSHENFTISTSMIKIINIIPNYKPKKFSYEL